MESLVLMHPDQELDISDILKLEELTGFVLPEGLKSLYLKYNGGTPDRSWVVTDDGFEPIQISDFKPISAKETEISRNTNFIGGCYKLMLARQVIPHTLLPFGVDDGGNFFCLDMLSGAVMFYAVDTFRADVRMSANHIAAQRIIASTFQEFTDGLCEESGLDY